MKEPKELFHILEHDIDFKKIGLDVDYNIICYDNEKTIRLFFQGSRSKLDWKLNFTFPVKAYKNQKHKLRYHSGWIKAYKSANDTIMTDLIKEFSDHPDYSIEIIGHSLGGALAIYATEDFNFRTDKKVTLITFGAPKAVFGKKTKKRLLDCCNEIYQYTHKNDLVPVIPPFYKHLKVAKCGKFSFFQLFKFVWYHTNYDKDSYYA